MKDLFINGFNVRLTKYKLIIYEVSDKTCTSKDAETVVSYLWEEGFIKKDNFPVEIIEVNS